MFSAVPCAFVHIKKFTVSSIDMHLFDRVVYLFEISMIQFTRHHEFVREGGTFLWRSGLRGAAYPNSWRKPE